jgi:hypothetical protein
VITARRGSIRTAVKVEVLLALVRNPSFSNTGKEALVRQLNHLAFEPNKTAILDALQKRAELR